MHSALDTERKVQTSTEREREVGYTILYLDCYVQSIVSTKQGPCLLITFSLKLLNKAEITYTRSWVDYVWI